MGAVRIGALYCRMRRDWDYHGWRLTYVVDIDTLTPCTDYRGYLVAVMNAWGIRMKRLGAPGGTFRCYNSGNVLRRTPLAGGLRFITGPEQASRDGTKRIGLGIMDITDGGGRRRYVVTSCMIPAGGGRKR